MTEFQTMAIVTSSNDAEIVSLLNWVASTYGAQVTNATASGTSKRCQFGFVFSTLQEAIDALTAIKTQFGDRLVDYELAMTR